MVKPSAVLTSPILRSSAPCLRITSLSSWREFSVLIPVSSWTYAKGRGVTGRRRRGVGSHSRPIVVDAFSGVGGLSLGLELAGFSSALHIEIEEQASRYAEFNFPLATHWGGNVAGDIRQVTPRSIELATAGREIAIFAGGPPCQGFSRAGRRRVDDPLNDLVLEMASLILELQPQAFIIENVAGSQDGQYWQFSKALDMLSAKYSVLDPTTLKAEQFGVPQQRRRVFTLGIRDDLHATPVAPTPTHATVSLQENLFLEGTPTVGDAILDLPNCDDYPHLFDGDEVQYERRAMSAYARMMRDPSGLTSARGYAVDWDHNVCTNMRRTNHGQALTEKLRGLQPGKADKSSRIPRLRADGLSPTIRAGTTAERGSWSAPRPCHPIHPRVITTRECARLQSFPDWFRFHPVKWHGNRQVGNAVPPLLARAVGRSLYSTLGYGSGDQDRLLESVVRNRDLVAQDIADAQASNLSRRRTSHLVVNTDLASRRKSAST